ncbi:MAG: MFS transporter [Alphaproteobacteria bacterium]|nr:MFS transporter [Alphaproteobacteria bacterium]
MTDAAALRSAGVARAGWLLAFAMTGDALLYVLLPLMPEAFGVTLAWAGLLLAANRIIRIFAYTHLARFAARLGGRRAGTLAAVGAVLSTCVFAFDAGDWVQLAGRFVWGLSFAVLNLVTFAYAASVPERAGRRIGSIRAIAGVAITITYLAGTYFVDRIGPQALYVVMTLVTLAGVPLAMGLPAVEIRAPAHRGFLLPRPGPVDIWAIAQGFVVDGVFIVSLSLLLKESVSEFAPAFAAGIAMSMRWIVETFCAPAGGWLADRFGATRVMLAFGVAIAAGMAAIAFGFVYPGVIGVTLLRGLTNTTGAAMVAERNPGDPVGAQSIYSTYRDIGAACGPVFAGLFLDDFARMPLYLALAAILGGSAVLLRARHR